MEITLFNLPEQEIFLSLTNTKIEIQNMYNQIQNYDYYKRFDPTHIKVCTHYTLRFLPHLKTSIFSKYLSDPALGYKVPQMVLDVKSSRHISIANDLLLQYQQIKISTCLSIIDDINSRIQFLDAMHKSIIWYKPINNLESFNYLFNTASNNLYPDYIFKEIIENKNNMFISIQQNENQTYILEDEISNLMRIHSEFYEIPLLQLTSKI